MSKHRGWVGFVFALGLASLGCGDDDGTGTGTPPPPVSGALSAMIGPEGGILEG